MAETTSTPSAVTLLCAKCQLVLATSKVNASYLGNSFPVDLLRCPGCGFTYVSESLALGKMLQVERALEDK